MQDSWEATVMAQVTGLLPPYGRPGLSSQFLTLAQSSPKCFKYLGSKPRDKTLSQINNEAKLIPIKIWSPKDNEQALNNKKAIF